MPTTRTFAIVFGSTWGCILLGSIAGGALEAWAAGADPATGRTIEITVKSIFLTLFVIQAVCLVPLALRAFVRGQIRIGNENHPVVKVLLKNETAVICAVWVVMGLGLAMALPVMITELF